MKNLTDTTFIIPVFVESEDRYNNAISVLGYLNHHFKTNVIIHELIQEESRLDFLDNLKNLKIKHITEVFTNGIYHRTRQLNEMLNLTETKVVVNYDIDVILPVESYVKSQELILNNESDMVYPYENGKFQRRILKTFNRDNFNNDFNLENLKEGDYDYWDARYGHCFFANIERYISCGGENENFLAYGPEDTERYERFNKVGYKVDRLNDYVYHFEHYRTPNSNNKNAHFESNESLYESLSEMNKEEIVDYYNKASYKNKYEKFRDLQLNQ